MCPWSLDRPSHETAHGARAEALPPTCPNARARTRRPGFPGETDPATGSEFEGHRPVPSPPPSGRKIPADEGPAREKPGSQFRTSVVDIKRAAVCDEPERYSDCWRQSCRYIGEAGHPES